METKRLQLQPVSWDDLGLYKKIMKSPEASRYLPKGEPYTDEEIETHVRNRVAHWTRGFGSYTIFDKSHPETPCGYAGVEISPNADCCDIRYGLIDEVKGRGFALEAAEAVLRETFRLGTHEKIYGAALEENRASLAILRKLGMTPEANQQLIYKEPGLVTLSISKTDFDHRAI